ncbi:MAG: ammonia-forming cytochrome c nitrite reductase subunit c552 [Gammaproteobacteria bacterium]|nr:ammonia-forming cytochrome c nitrite reductase subunit c552 [Gammaproteobacteria bacterium]
MLPGAARARLSRMIGGPVLKWMQLGGLVLLTACGARESSVPAAAEPQAAPVFVGTRACTECHEPEYRAWQGSHHDLAMDVASPDTVLGDFSDVTFEYFDQTSRFFLRNGKYMLRTAASSGAEQEFEITHTFGVDPLQQYLVSFPDGRLQALSIAWDTRTAEQGGQRWFHLSPDEYIAADDPLHWTRREYNWNYMCAECHSTDLQKNYDLASDTFASTWVDIDVGCEACHGPGSAHVEFARAGQVSVGAGLLLDLDDAGSATWLMDPLRGIASRSEPRMQPPKQPEACGRCHARRSVIAAEYRYGRPLLDTHRPALLGDPLYYPDGQILEEVYVYGSFLQSRMYQAGVSCSDCHDPHSNALKTGSTPSDICSTCHLPGRFDDPAHHRHPERGVSCVDCHMPETSYMVVDPRRDHSFRIPRPDVSVSTSAPNACNACHAEQDAQWASNALREWFGDPPSEHFANAFHAAHSGDPAANDKLVAVAADMSIAGIVRGTALSRLRAPLTRDQAESLRLGLQDPDGLVRLGAVQGLAALPAQVAAQWAADLLRDPLLAVRLEAINRVSPAQQSLPAASRALFDQVAQEFLAAELANAERPEAHANIGNFHAAAGDYAAAEAAYGLSLEREPHGVTTRVNFADLYRVMQREDEAEKLLRAGIELGTDAAVLHHSLGLLLVRQQREQEAFGELARAAELAPDNARYTYVHAIALNSAGREDEAISIISQAARDFPADFDIGWAEVTLKRDAGEIDAARDAAQRLVERFPGNENALSLMQSFDAA